MSSANTQAVKLIKAEILGRSDAQRTSYVTGVLSVLCDVFKEAAAGVQPIGRLDATIHGFLTASALMVQTEVEEKYGADKAGATVLLDQVLAALEGARR